MNKREIVIAGNWKMNHNSKETAEFINTIKPDIESASCKVILAVPYTSLYAGVQSAMYSPIKISAQNCHWEDNGAFTGEISPSMLLEIGVNYTIIGHSERRQFFGETDVSINNRVKAALKAGIKPIICVGETSTQRHQGIANKVCSMQIKFALDTVSEKDLKNVIIAYEPIWAIGTGQTATSEQAEESCSYIRSIISHYYSCSAAELVPILYGGSMNEKNAQELLSKPNIDGGLIGGASLKTESFKELIKIGSNIKK